MILITGGTGFIGSRLALHCLQRGDPVRILGQTNNAYEEANKRAVEAGGGQVYVGSITEAEMVRKAVQGADVVYHLAAAQHEANVGDDYFWDINVKGTKHVLDSSLQVGVRRFVHGSTIGVYGEALVGEIDERTSIMPDNIYGTTKSEGEKLALAYADRLPVVVVRISETYGPGDKRLLKLFKAIKNKAFFMIGSGENKHQLIYVDDLIQGLTLVANQGDAVGEVFVLAGKEVVTTNQIVQTVADALGVRLRKLRFPLLPFVIVASALERVCRPLGIQPPLHQRRLDFFRKSFFFSRQKAETIVGFEPTTSFKEGIGKTVRWYRETGLL